MLMDGTVLRCEPRRRDRLRRAGRSRCRRRPSTPAGYRLAPGMDWVDLFVRGEGTLGVITEARVETAAGSRRTLFAGVIFFAER